MPPLYQSLRFNSGKFFPGRDVYKRQEESSIRRNHGTLYKMVVEQPGGKPFEFGTGIEEAEARQ